jgi:hypothetical protein
LFLTYPLNHSFLNYLLFLKNLNFHYFLRFHLFPMYQLSLMNH